VTFQFQMSVINGINIKSSTKFYRKTWAEFYPRSSGTRFFLISKRTGFKANPYDTAWAADFKNDEWLQWTVKRRHIPVLIGTDRDDLGRTSSDRFSHVGTCAVGCFHNILCILPDFVNSLHQSVILKAVHSAATSVISA
jgi:hypothetical protein